MSKEKSLCETATGAFQRLETLSEFFRLPGAIAGMRHVCNEVIRLDE